MKRRITIEIISQNRQMGGKLRFVPPAKRELPPREPMMNVSRVEEEEEEEEEDGQSLAT